MADISRRSFLNSTLATGALFGLEGLLTRGASAMTARSRPDAPGGYGPLQPVKATNTGEYVLALPAGFSYTVFGKTGSMMSDGNTTPQAHDGMAAFSAPGGKIRLVRNHEIKGKPGVGFLGAPGGYDPTAPGGCTTLIVDPKTRTMEKDFLSLAGTSTNCAGGPTPWGSWISCEETTIGPKAGFAKDHGYCFEVASRADGKMSDPVPLKAMGRFVHEAVAVDPRSGIVYLTEDRGTAGFYRFIPKKKGKLAEGGRLQIAAVKDRKNFDTRSGQKPGATYTLVWVDIEDADPKNAEDEPMAVYNEGQAKGAATFARLEGCWYGQGSIFIDATNGGDKQLGQIFQYTPQGDAEGKLTLLFESPDPQVLAMPDNLCVSPRGGLVLCEDSDETNQYVRGLTMKGELFDLIRNILPGYETQEFAGATFSPDGQTLFVNVQTPGITCAIWGPWDKGAL
ncbi:MAG: DUF839 domain-containing protein [Armatimonadaceae bacterium]